MDGSPQAERMKELMGTFMICPYRFGTGGAGKGKDQFSNLVLDFLTENAPLLEKQKYHSGYPAAWLFGLS